VEIVKNAVIQIHVMRMKKKILNAMMIFVANVEKKLMNVLVKAVTTLVMSVEIMLTSANVMTK
jgi:hypothetical protein